MDFTLENSDSLYQIQSYDLHSFKINDDIYTQSLLLMPNQLIYPWSPQTYAELTTEHLIKLIDYKTNIILLGSGNKSVLPDYTLLAPLYQAHIGVEVMDTAAACRTFNVLATEGRHVLAALIIG